MIIQNVIHTVIHDGFHAQADGVEVATQSLATDFLQNSATAFFRWGFAQQLAASILLAWLACSVDLHGSPKATALTWHRQTCEGENLKSKELSA